MLLNQSVRIAVDIGGTFTDCVIQGDMGLRIVTKSLTTKSDPSLGVMNCIEIGAQMLGVQVSVLLNQTTAFVHGTTVGTNALTERKGVRTGLLMTRGHEQTITIGRVRQKVMGLSEREKIHVTHLSKAHPPIVDPIDIRPITERIDSSGEIIVKLDLIQAEKALDDLVESGISSIAVCLLWSFANPIHEEAILALVKRKYPDLFVSISSEVSPRSGEYERVVSTALNSYIGPIVGDYLVRLEQRLQTNGLTCSLLVMQANGGLTTVDAVLGRPLLTVDSGPAGGVLGGRFASSIIGHQNIICADVGGTTFDVGIVNQGRVQMDSQPVIKQYAYLMPKIFIKSIGAGGGSIAWVDPGGSLRVGPQSAGSNPGPATYGRGGVEPTVTDAHVVLGYLAEEFPLGGTVKVDLKKAQDSILRVAAPLGMSVVEVATAILEISNAHMADLVRKVTVERGLDPRKFVLFLYGGAGPIFAGFLASQVGNEITYVPAESGVFSAMGMLTSDIELQEERSVNFKFPFTKENLEKLNQIFSITDEKLMTRFKNAGFDVNSVELRRTVDMRFGMQVHELEVDAPNGVLTQHDIEKLEKNFPIIYEGNFGPGSAYLGAGIDLVTLRSIGSIAIPKPNFGALTNQAKKMSSLIGERLAYFSMSSGALKTEVHLGEQLVAGQKIIGPAIIQRYADTVVIPPGTQLSMDDVGGLSIVKIN